MTPLLIISSGFILFFMSLYHIILEPLFLSPLAKISGPRIYAITKWRLALDEWKGIRTRKIHNLHKQCGSVVRIGSNEVHFNSSTALHAIYGAGSGFERTKFYRMFDVYGRQNVFTFASVKEHSDRKKLLANAYSKSKIIRGPAAEEIESKVADFMDLIGRDEGRPTEIYSRLHWYSLDNITNFIYGRRNGGTTALKGVREHQGLIDDIVDPKRRELTWFLFHFTTLTKWLYNQEGVLERVVAPFLPMKKPTSYSAIRAHALKAMRDFSAAVKVQRHDIKITHVSLIANLWNHHESEKSGGLGDLDIASECSDHFLAGIDTTSDTIIFLIWALSRPENHLYQRRLIEEARSISESDLNQDSNPTVETADKLPYLSAVLTEALRLYAPIPESEPRLSPKDTMIDGYLIPARTTVSMAPYSLHRNSAVFPNALEFDPERWLGSENKVAEQKKWFWAFSSGRRMCVGQHLAMAEMALVPAIYRKYSTSIRKGDEGVSPGIIARFEMFCDETCKTARVSVDDGCSFCIPIAS